MTDQPDRYYPDFGDCGEAFPWVVYDRLEGPNEYIGPCMNPRDAALIAWALNHRRELMQAHLDLQHSVDECVGRLEQSPPSND